MFIRPTRSGGEQHRTESSKQKVATTILHKILSVFFGRFRFFAPEFPGISRGWHIFITPISSGNEGKTRNEVKRRVICLAGRFPVGKFHRCGRNLLTPCFGGSGVIGIPWFLIVGDVLESYVLDFPGCLSRGSAKTEGNVVKSD